MNASKLTEIVAEIEKHHLENPDHGTNCACLDTYIRQVRKMTTVDNAGAQRRIDYVLRKAAEYRP
jgi:hypothetical protein